MSKVLIVEDDILIAELERDYLNASGFEAEIQQNGTHILDMVRKEKYDALILDIMLPGKSGLDICRELRRESSIPILMVTAKKEKVDKLRGLGLGADDYMVKPFSPAELVARVRTHIHIHEMLLNQKEEELERGIDVGELLVLPRQRRVFLNGQEIILANKEFELLQFLVENPNIVFSKNTIFERIWGEDSVGNTATVTVHINRLREKLDGDSYGLRHIQTVWGAGYRFHVGK
ncbi:response regulator transcription factor [Enterocloster citroniae]|uniref:response regulator transcription factor n=1 Tax=Enterocloster citroniae TaxID=358743 RepID=UPI001D082E1A|nr:response regulator transcription factor [Enterocloster citroniae]MCB7066873.1 response regulator transcription factor [Enterocloster citroniae]